MTWEEAEKSVKIGVPVRAPWWPENQSVRLHNGVSVVFCGEQMTNHIHPWFDFTDLHKERRYSDSLEVYKIL